MRISKVDALAYSIPYATPVVIATGTLTVQESVLVRITADDGTVGLGETQPIPFFQGCAETQDTILSVIRNIYAPLLLGQSPFDIERLHQAMERAIGGGNYARAAVGDALYDLVARLLDVPLCDFLGGRYRERIAAVWSIGMKSSQAMADEARQQLERGYSLLKCKIGSPDPITDIENVAAMQPQTALPQVRSPAAGRPIPVAYIQPGGEAPGAPIPAYVQGAGGGVAPARYDQPHLPNYAWPSYAAYPNYAALTYPKQYSPTAWPFIGPFYPYPQVPLGWRKVTLEWDDGWWMLDFKD